MTAWQPWQRAKSASSIAVDRSPSLMLTLGIANKSLVTGLGFLDHLCNRNAV
jgi:hypothetical protein